MRLCECDLQDGCTCLHAAVRSGRPDTLRHLLCHPAQGDPGATLEPPAALLNRANSDGWTAAHMAAALGLKVSSGSASRVTPNRKWSPLTSLK